jgi:hypothetical protein
MKAWKKSAKAFEWHSDYQVKGKMRTIQNRLVRAKLKVELLKEQKEAFDAMVERAKFSRKLSF